LPLPTATDKSHLRFRFKLVISQSSQSVFLWLVGRSYLRLLFVLQDLQALRSSRRYDYSLKCCSLKDFLALVMGALVVVILWTRHGSQTKPQKKSFVFPVYAAPVNLTWRDASFNDPSSIFRGSLRRSLMADKPEASNYISEVRPVAKHMYMISLIETVLSLEIYTCFPRI